MPFGLPAGGRIAKVLSPLGDNFSVVLALVSLYVIWGSTYFGIRIAIESFPPFMMAGVRFIIAGSILFFVVRARGQAAPTRSQWFGSAIAGVLLLAGGNGGVTFAEQWVTSGLAAVWVATVPLWTALFAALLGQRSGKLEWAGLILGFVGVAVLNFDNNLRGNPTGVIALTAATACWALGSVISRRLPLPSGMISSAAQMLAGGAALCVLSVVTGERLAAPPTARSLLAVMYLIIFGSMIAFSAYAYLLRRVRAALATSYAYVNPLIAVGLGAALGGERLTGYGIVAMLIILGGVGLVMMGRERKETRK